MNNLKICHITLNFNFEITYYNKNFLNLCSQNKLPNNDLEKFFNLPDINIFSIIKNSDNKNYLAFINSNNDHKCALLLMYMNITKTDNGYKIYLVNWINWIHSLYDSLNNGYNFLSEFNAQDNTNKFTKISDIYCFKVFQPILSLIPIKKLRISLKSDSLYSIFNSFINLRNKNKEKASFKDYNRNVYSRLNTSIKKEFGVKYNHDTLGNFIKKINLCINENITDMFILNTELKNNILISIKQDQLLEHYFNNCNIID